ncbi:MAG: hypothetical protein QXE22_00110 [Candidatus Bathyarchaeia archaeon]
MKKALISHKVVSLVGILLYYSIFIALSTVTPMMYFKDSMQARVSNLLEALEVLGWGISSWKRAFFFLDHTLMAFYGITLGKVDWEFTFKIKDLLALIPMAFLTGLYLTVAYDYSHFNRFRCPRRAISRLNRGGLYASPLSALASSLLNAALWVGGCGSCGGTIGITFIALLGLSVWLAKILYAAAAIGMLSSTFYLSWRILKAER